jgi:hypothetical protein
MIRKKMGYWGQADKKAFTYGLQRLGAGDPDRITD